MKKIIKKNEKKWTTKKKKSEIFSRAEKIDEVLENEHDKSVHSNA
jgi:hypothetical protein